MLKVFDKEKPCRLECTYSTNTEPDMIASDNPINPQAWYFRAADAIAPGLIVSAGLFAVFALSQFVATF
jgi:hypothetical protein